MPYKISGKNVMHFKSGKWSVKQKCSSTSNAKEAINLLRGIEHSNWRPTKKGKKR